MYVTKVNCRKQCVKSILNLKLSFTDLETNSTYKEILDKLSLLMIRDLCSDKQIYTKFQLFKEFLSL